MLSNALCWAMTTALGWVFCFLFFFFATLPMLRQNLFGYSRCSCVFQYFPFWHITACYSFWFSTIHSNSLDSNSPTKKQQRSKKVFKNQQLVASFPLSNFVEVECSYNVLMRFMLNSLQLQFLLVVCISAFFDSMQWWSWFCYL